MRTTITTLMLFLVIPFGALAQGLLSGRIIDSNSLSLPGATIEIKALSKKAVSDETGHYKLLGYLMVHTKLILLTSDLS